MADEDRDGAIVDGERHYESSIRFELFIEREDEVG